MRMHRVLTAALEVKTEARGSTQQLELSAEVESDAMADATALFKRKQQEDDEEPERVKKQPKGSLESQRSRKVKSGLSQGNLLLGQLRSSELRHTSELCSNLEKNLGLLKQRYCDFAAAGLEGEEASEAVWKEVVALSTEVSNDITDGQKRLNPSSKAYSTPYDSVLG